MTNEMNLENTRIYGTDLQPWDSERLRGQLKKVYDIMKDGRKRTTCQIGEIAKCPAASAHRHLSTLRTQFGAIVNKELLGQGLWQYWIAGFEPVKQTKKKLKPVGDPEKFGELMRLVYAYANTSPIRAGLVWENMNIATKEWVDDLVKRVKLNNEI